MTQREKIELLKYDESYDDLRDICKKYNIDTKAEVAIGEILFNVTMREYLFSKYKTYLSMMGEERFEKTFADNLDEAIKNYVINNK